MCVCADDVARRRDLVVFSRNTFARECIFFERLTELVSEFRFVSARSYGKRARREIEVELDRQCVSVNLCKNSHSLQK